MTLITDILSRAARQCSVPEPGSWITDTTQTIAEMRDFLSETVDDIQERVDMPYPLSQSVTIAFTDVERNPLPADFKRLTRTTYSVYEQNLTRRAVIPVSVDGEWQYISDFGASGAERYYRIEGYPGAYTISFLNPLGAGDTVIVNYVSTLWTVEGTDAFTAVTQSSRLPRRILEAGIVFRFRERKGLPMDGKLSEYEALLTRFSNDGRGRRVIVFGRGSYLDPLNIPVPDFIPPAS